MHFLIILVVAGLAQVWLPWWVIAIVPLLVFFSKPTKGISAFVNSFFAIALVWFGYGWYLHYRSDGRMSDRIAELFSLPNGIVLLVVVSLVAGVVAGFSGLAGYLAGEIIWGGGEVKGQGKLNHSDS